MGGQLAIVVDVEEAYMPCAKALLRSRAWQADTWLAKEQRPVVADPLAAHVNQAHLPAATIAEALQTSYTERLY